MRRFARRSLGTSGPSSLSESETKTPRYLVGEFGPVFDEHDLSNLENHHIYLKLMIDGVTSKPFSAVTLPSPDVDVSHREKIVESSRARFAKKREDIEKAIMTARYRPITPPEKPRQKNLF